MSRNPKIRSNKHKKITNQKQKPKIVKQKKNSFAKECGTWFFFGLK